MISLETSQTFLYLLIALPFVLIGLAIIYAIYINRQTNRQRQAILARSSDWPPEITAALLSKPRAWKLDKIDSIMAKRPAWTDEQVLSIFRHKVSIGMTNEMVTTSWGNPTAIENKEITAKGKKTRWIYGTPRKGAQYLWFINDELTKIQQ